MPLQFLDGSYQEGVFRVHPDGSVLFATIADGATTATVHLFKVSAAQVAANPLPEKGLAPCGTFLLPDNQGTTGNRSLVAGLGAWPSSSGGVDRCGWSARQQPLRSRDHRVLVAGRLRELSAARDHQPQAHGPTDLLKQRHATREAGRAPTWASRAGRRGLLAAQTSLALRVSTVCAFGDPATIELFLPIAAAASSLGGRSIGDGTGLPDATEPLWTAMRNAIAGVVRRTMIPDVLRRLTGIRASTARPPRHQGPLRCRRFRCQSLFDGLRHELHHRRLGTDAVKLQVSVQVLGIRVVSCVHTVSSPRPIAIAFFPSGRNHP
jgi:hypothetical protein